MKYTIIIFFSILAGVTIGIMYERHLETAERLDVVLEIHRTKDNDSAIDASVNVTSTRRGAIYQKAEIKKLDDPVVFDPRLKQYMDGWSAWELYRGRRVEIPHVWTLHAFEYNPYEKQVWLALGWHDKRSGKGFDAEAIVSLGLFDTDPHVKIEIARLGGAEIHVCYKGKEMAAFPTYRHYRHDAGVRKGYFAGEFPIPKN